MKKIKITRLILLLLWPFCLKAQGIVFQSQLSYKEAVEKAKRENKYLFIDIMATWCGPCRMMDSLVYTQSDVGDFINKNFISVKVQIDRTKFDSEIVKKWYTDADSINKKYKIRSYPTFLFFSPNGELTGRASGFKPSVEFLESASNAMDHSKSFPIMVRRFQEGTLDENEMRMLALLAYDMEEKVIANEVALAYKDKYLDPLGVENVMKKTSIEFILKFLNIIESTDNFFKAFYTYPDIVDELTGNRGFSWMMVQTIVAKEEVTNKIWDGNKPRSIDPDWNSMQRNIKRKYSEKLAVAVIIDEKIRWYEYHKQWPELVKYNVERVERVGLDTVGIRKVLLNNMIYEIIFKHTDRPEILNKGIEWIKILLKSSPNRHSWIDTYANLLYKVGRTEEGIHQEHKALAIARTENNQRSIESYTKKILLMKSRQPTWN